VDSSAECPPALVTTQGREKKLCPAVQSCGKKELMIYTLEYLQLDSPDARWTRHVKTITAEEAKEIEDTWDPFTGSHDCVRRISHIPESAQLAHVLIEKNPNAGYAQVQ
jgi:hypothetical protein